MGQEKEEANKRAMEKKQEQAQAQIYRAMRAELSRITDLEGKNNFNVQSDEIDIVLKMFQEKYCKKPDGTTNSEYKAPTKNNDGSRTFLFPSTKEDGSPMTDTEILEEATSFFTSVAEKNVKTVILDKHNGNVLGYSNGDGKLYHPDGQSFKSGDRLSREKGIPMGQFDMSLLNEPKGYPTPGK